jgi:hypothetical protein
MNIQTVATNLRNTIAGKEQLYESYAQDLRDQYGSNDPDSITKMTVALATRDFLRINIAELKRILQDLEQCIDKETT